MSSSCPARLAAAANIVGGGIPCSSRCGHIIIIINRPWRSLLYLKRGAALQFQSTVYILGGLPEISIPSTIVRPSFLYRVWAASHLLVDIVIAIVKTTTMMRYYPASGPAQRVSFPLGIGGAAVCTLCTTCIIRAYTFVVPIIMYVFSHDLDAHRQVTPTTDSGFSAAVPNFTHGLVFRPKPSFAKPAQLISR